MFTVFVGNTTGENTADLFVMEVAETGLEGEDRHLVHVANYTESTFRFHQMYNIALLPNLEP
jgi:hypothetical protein